MARTTYHGDYPGLFGAWTAFGEWLAANGHAVADDLFETYLSDPAQMSDPARYETRLERPLL